MASTNPPTVGQIRGSAMHALLMCFKLPFFRCIDVINWVDHVFLYTKWNIYSYIYIYSPNTTFSIAVYIGLKENSRGHGVTKLIRDTIIIAPLSTLTGWLSTSVCSLWMSLYHVHIPTLVFHALHAMDAHSFWEPNDWNVKKNRISIFFFFMYVTEFISQHRKVFPKNWIF